MELRERLANHRKLDEHTEGATQARVKIIGEAADEIARLDAEVARLRRYETAVKYFRRGIKAFELEAD